MSQMKLSASHRGSKKELHRIKQSKDFYVCLDNNKITWSMSDMFLFLVCFSFVEELLISHVYIAPR